MQSIFYMIMQRGEKRKFCLKTVNHFQHVQLDHQPDNQPYAQLDYHPDQQLDHQLDQQLDHELDHQLDQQLDHELDHQVQNQVDRSDHSIIGLVNNFFIKLMIKFKIKVDQDDHCRAGP